MSADAVDRPAPADPPPPAPIPGPPPPGLRPRVKVCCVQDAAEAALATAHGADLIGLVGPGLSGPEVIDDIQVARVARTVPPPVMAVLLTRQQDPDALAAQVRFARTPAVQICDAVPVRAYAEVRSAVPSIHILQVVHVTGPEAVAEAHRVARFADALVLDSGSPAPSGPDDEPVYGGTGTTHDWSISARIVAEVDRPVFLAGGLNADNVAEAWQTVRPYGFDLCSGVRTDGRMDPDKVAAFLAAVRALGV